MSKNKSRLTVKNAIIISILIWIAAIFAALATRKFLL